MRRNYKLEDLQKGKTIVTSEKGNSMVPLIKSGQKHKIQPTTIEEVVVGDIVYCKCKGSFYTHIIKSMNDKKGCLIGNNKGGINGWTKKIYGKVIKILK